MIEYQADPLQDGISKIKLRSHNGSDRHICNTARNSLDASEENKTDEENERLIKYLYQNQHTSPFEFADYDFTLVLPLFVAQQWLRHRTGKYNQASERFRLLPNKYYIPKPHNIEGQSERKLQCRNGMMVDIELAKDYIKDLECLTEASTSFRKKYRGNVANELVRLGSTHNLYTIIMFKMDLNNLLHFVRLRTDSNAQWEIRQYANCILECIKLCNPAVYKAYTRVKFITQIYNNERF